MRRPMGRRNGFSLVEALVALAIAALAFTAIFALQDQMTVGQMRLQRTLDTAAVQRNGLELLADINPMEEPSGQRNMTGGRVISWTAEPVTETRRNAGFPSGEGVFDVALYQVDAVITTAGGRELGRLQFRRLGWRRAFGDFTL